MKISLLGDSQAVRMRNTWGGTRAYDYAKGGWTTRELKTGLREVRQLLHFCILFVGLNDILKGKNTKETKTNIRAIIKLLGELGKHIIIITLPPTLHADQKYNKSLFELNVYLKSFKSQKYIEILPFDQIFRNKTVQQNKHYFQQSYWNGRPDLIHCSSAAHSEIRKRLREVIDRIELNEHKNSS